MQLDTTIHDSSGRHQYDAILLYFDHNIIRGIWKKNITEFKTEIHWPCLMFPFMCGYKILLLNYWKQYGTNHLNCVLHSAVWHATQRTGLSIAIMPLWMSCLELIQDTWILQISYAYLKYKCVPKIKPWFWKQTPWKDLLLSQCIIRTKPLTVPTFSVAWNNFADVQSLFKNCL